MNSATRNRPQSSGLRPPGRAGLSALKRWLLVTGLLAFFLGAGFFVYFYVHFSRMIDARLSGRVFNHASVVCSAPTKIIAGQSASLNGFVSRLQKAGYSDTPGGTDLGTYKIEGNRLEIDPGDHSYFQGDIIREGPAALTFGGGRLVSIEALPHDTQLEDYWLEPEVITPLFGSLREKRQVVRYEELPKDLVDAVLSAEDSSFFTHHGVNFYRILGAAVADIRAGQKVQGGSTLTMQLAKNFFLTPQRTYRRKLEEVFIAFLLEQRLSKERIFELYANEVYLGQRNSFALYGLKAAANAYFGKDVSSLTLSESALLAGLIRGPNLYSPSRHPVRALERRNYVLRRMLKLGFITADEATDASGAPLGVTPETVEQNQAPFFVDMVRDQLLGQFSEEDLLTKHYRIYTTLDLDLQNAAAHAVQEGMAEVDQHTKHLKPRRDLPPPGRNEPQVAFIALDPHDGDILALVGGRDYAQSQLNHVLAKRQPGSTFKSFVYAAALNTALDGSQPLITPATTLLDEPTVFHFGDTDYEPENYEQDYRGVVTVREAITHSLNVATVRLAQMVGYDKVRNLAIAAGINQNIEATPAIALGAYDSTPLEIAGAYTIFANNGVYLKPRLIREIDDDSGHTIWRSDEITRQVLDPRICYLMDSLLESVIDRGTGAGVRSRGFLLPCAGKTGTSHDGWFSGFTSNLLATVWVGYDDDRELRLAGASSGLPVWTDFMIRATQLPAYQNVQPFTEPPGIVTEMVDQQGKPVPGTDPTQARLEYFVDGTQPQQSTGVMGGILGRIFKPFKSSGQAAPATAAPPPAPMTQTGTSPETPSTVEQQEPQTAPQKKNGGFFKKFWSIFKHGPSKPSTEPPNPPPPSGDKGNERR